MNEAATEVLTKRAFRKAVEQAGGPQTLAAAFKGLRSANVRLEQNYSRILEEYSGNWIAMGPEGLIANVPVPEGSSQEEEQNGLERLVELVSESEQNTQGYVVRYIKADEGKLIL